MGRRTYAACVDFRWFIRGLSYICGPVLKMLAGCNGCDLCRNHADTLLSCPSLQHLVTTAHGNRCRKEVRHGVQGLKTKGNSVLMKTGMAKRNHKKAHTPEDISFKNSVLEDRLIGGLDNKYDDSVQKLIDIGKEKGYLLYDEVSDLLPPEIGASAEDLDELFSAFGTAGIEVIAAVDQNFDALDKISGEKKFDTEATEEGIELDLTPGALEKANDPVRMYLREMGTVP